MDTEIDPLILDLVDWLAERERTCKEVMCGWRSVRSRLPIWDEAIQEGFVMTELVSGRCVMRPTSLGLLEGEFRREIKRQFRQHPGSWARRNLTFHPPEDQTPIGAAESEAVR
jgi:hypothetical protein